jgi:hypothetical protein
MHVSIQMLDIPDTGVNKIFLILILNRGTL